MGKLSLIFGVEGSGLAHLSSIDNVTEVGKMGCKPNMMGFKVQAFKVPGAIRVGSVNP